MSHRPGAGLRPATPTHYMALATDYDGTIAHDGVVDGPTLAALKRLRAAHRRLILVTGREFDDLLQVMPRLDLFDRVVAENGAVLYTPETRAVRLLAPSPSPAFVDRLRADKIDPLAIGRAIVATGEREKAKVLAAISDLGLDLEITLNKGSVMVLPAGINKESGLRAALADLDLMPINVVAVGDAENDFAFFTLCGMTVAVHNALPSLKQAAVFTTTAARGAGVAELIGRMLDTDLAELEVGNARQQVGLADGLSFSPHRTSLLLTGKSNTGKKTLITGLLERLASAGMQALVLDTEGHYGGLASAAEVGSAQDAPQLATIIQALLQSAGCVTVNLEGVALADRPAFYAHLLPKLLVLRARTGRPHCIAIDEAHQMLPHGYDPAAAPSSAAPKGMLYVTTEPDALSGQIVGTVDRIVALGKLAEKALAAFAQSAGLAGPAALGPARPGMLLTLGHTGPAQRLTIIA